MRFFPLLTLILTLAANVAADDSVSGDAKISGKFKGSDITITTTSRLAGAVHSLTWDGKEFIDSADHGRQLQSASNYDCGKPFYPEVFNPTEAGSSRDGSGPKSTSRLRKLEAKDNRLLTRTQMAFWLAPGQKSAGHRAYNDRRLSDHLLEKRVQIGYGEFENVITYDVTFTVPRGEGHKYAQFEAVTGYMPPEFSAFWKLNPKSLKLETLDDGPGEQPWPVVLSTPSGSHAMGIFSPDQPAKGYEGAGYGRFRFKAEKVVKWNSVFRVRDEKGIEARDYSFRNFVVIGTRDEVESGLGSLVKEFVAK